MATHPDSALAPLRFPLYRALWIGAFAGHLAIWMQSVGAAWLMATMTSSTLVVALVQTATSLPAFFFGLPGGVIADLVDRRRYLLGVQLTMLASAVALAALTLSGLIAPWSLLALTALLGACFALQIPAWHTTQAESVPLRTLPAALVLGAVSYNAARAVGPALAGGIAMGVGPAAVFAAAGVCLCVGVVVIFRWRYVRHVGDLPPERLLRGLRSAIRYTAHSQVMRMQMLRTAAFVSAGGGLWALLPVLARDQLNIGAGGYGVLFGSLGGGAILGAFLLPSLQKRIEVNALVTGAVVLYSAATLVAAYVPLAPVVCLALVPAGAAWMMVGNINLAAMQTAIPAWIRARAIAVYMLTFQGAMALSGGIWGGAAEYLGVSGSLAVAAVTMTAGLVILRRNPVRFGSEAEVTPSSHDFPQRDFRAPPAEEGPVAVQIEYQIDPTAKDEFFRAIHTVGRARRRDGSRFWRLYRDLSNPTKYVERFIVESWTEYLRQQSRATVADRLAEEHARSFHTGERSPLTSHYVAESFLESR
ncbi:MFS transporter [Aromatoleum petrolei]|uniref:MFS transporter n=1 Tax=Aromatoleum petrolei TaxID=76116 RepID=A0ABX1MLL2_9RHOO|nr:MFS transporter [Aromatoleum petrolei]NMF88638.1 MFS transporter [Aromatoleum petrolei]QTQ34649.1 Putative transmembrane secretion effector protein [Aromatoleum petrolei]